MKHDERGLPLSTDSAAAVTLFDRAVEHYLKFHADTMVLAGRALAADPGFVMGHCLKAYLLLMAANPANRAQIDATLASAHAGAANITARERMHLAAADAWHRGSLDHSFAIWRQILDARPDRSAGVPHLRHDLVPPRPDAADPRAGRPRRAALVRRSARL